MDNSLSSIIKRSYPFPISVYYKRYSKEERIVKKGKEDYKNLFLSMIDLFEITTRYLSIVSLSSYVKNGLMDPSLNIRIGEILTNKMALGHWFELFRETTRFYKENSKEMFMPELVPFLFENKTILLFDQLIALRNKKKGHSYTLTPNEYKELYEENIKLLEKILERLQFLANYTLISPIELEDNGHIIKVYNDFMGDSINEKDKHITIQSPAKEEEILLLKFNEYDQFDTLLLSPLTYYGYLEDTWEEYLFMHEENKINKQELKKLEYIGINSTAKTQKISINESEVSRLMWFEMFKEVLTSLLQMNGQILQQASQPNHSKKKDYYFHDQKTLMETYSKHFVSRHFVHEKFSSIHQNYSSGYFLFIGSPGQGKTAIAADLVNRNNHAIHHFISGNAGRNNEKSMILSLMQQIEQKMNIETNPSDDPNDLKREFAHMIESYSEWLLKEDKKDLIIIDGLDELDGSDDHLTLSYFPDFLPSNIYVVMLSRPINNLINLKSKITEEFTIPTMTLTEVHEIVSAIHADINDDLVSSLFYYSQGNPLLLNGILQEIGALSEIDINKIPRSIEEVFEHFIDQLYHSEDFTAIDILGLLSCTVGGLNLNTISSILKQRKHYVVKSLKRLDQFLVSLGGKIQLYHKKLSEYLLSPHYKYSFSSHEIEEYQDILIDYSLSHLDKQDDFISENIIRLLYIRNKTEFLKDIFQQDMFQQPAIAFLTELFRKKEGIDLLPIILQDSQTEIIEVVIAALEQAVSFGELNYSEQILTEYLGDLEQPKYQSKVHYLLAIIYKEKGQLQKAYDQFRYIRTELKEHLTRREGLLVDFEFANTAREFSEADIANQTYKEVLDQASLETEADFYLNAKRYLLNREHVQGRYLEADNGFKEIIRIAYEKGFRNIWADINKTYGLVYFEQERYEEAAEIFLNAFHVYKERNDLINLGRIYNDLSETYAYLDLNKAAYYADKAFNINSRIQKKLEIANSYRCFAIINRHKGEFTEALNWINKAIELYTEIGYKSGVGKAYYHKSLILFKLEEFDEMIDAVNNCHKWFIRKNSLSHGVYVLKAFLLQTVFYEKTGQAEKIQELQSKYPPIEPFEGIAEFKERIKLRYI